MIKKERKATVKKMKRNIIIIIIAAYKKIKTVGTKQ
jgi:hypothetical protein